MLSFAINRDALQKFFYPFDYQEIQATKPLVPGQRRVHTGLDVKFDFECDSTLDILFSKNRVRFPELLWVCTLGSTNAVSLRRSSIQAQPALALTYICFRFYFQPKSSANSVFRL